MVIRLLPLPMERAVFGFAAAHPGKPVPPRAAVASITPAGYIVSVSLESQRYHVGQAILIPAERLHMPDLERFRNALFEKMIKFAVDVRLRKIALGDEMHADADEVLLHEWVDLR